MPDEPILNPSPPLPQRVFKITQQIRPDGQTYTNVDVLGDQDGKPDFVATLMVLHDAATVLYRSIIQQRMEEEKRGSQDNGKVPSPKPRIYLPGRFAGEN